MDRLAHELRLARLSEERYVDQLFALVLRREPDPPGRTSAIERLRKGHVSRATLLEELVASEEFLRVQALDDAIALARTDRASRQRPRLLTAPAEIDERAVEIRWVLSRYQGERRLLDTGSANAEPVYLAALPALGASELVGVDLAETEIPGLQIVRADLRSLPFADSSFDLCFCISTLEHVGADNSRYVDAEGETGGGPKEALTELRRVLRRGGRLLLTVPCGAHEEHGWFVQLSPEEWLELFERNGFFTREHELYVREPEGWRSSSAEEVSALRYGEQGEGAAAVLCAELRSGEGQTLRERLHVMRHRLGF